MLKLVLEELKIPVPAVPTITTNKGNSGGGTPVPDPPSSTRTTACFSDSRAPSTQSASALLSEAPSSSDHAPSTRRASALLSEPPSAKRLKTSPAVHEKGKSEGGREGGGEKEGRREKGKEWGEKEEGKKRKEEREISSNRPPTDT